MVRLQLFNSIHLSLHVFNKEAICRMKDFKNRGRSCCLSALNCASQMLPCSVVLQPRVIVCHRRECVSRPGEPRRLHFETISSHELKSYEVFLLHSSLHDKSRLLKAGCYAASHLIRTQLLKANPKIITGVISSQ